MIKEGVSMEEARKKLRICLIFVVLLAIIVGFVYYFSDIGKNDSVSEGTLVMTQTEFRG